MYYIYAIRSLKDGRIYVGLSQNVTRRVQGHNSGEVFSTKGYRPWKLIFTEACGTNRAIARKKEKYYKAGSGKEKIKSFIYNPE